MNNTERMIDSGKGDCFVLSSKSGFGRSECESPNHVICAYSVVSCGRPRLPKALDGWQVIGTSLKSGHETNDDMAEGDRFGEEVATPLWHLITREFEPHPSQRAFGVFALSGTKGEIAARLLPGNLRTGRSLKNLKCSEGFYAETDGSLSCDIRGEIGGAIRCQEFVCGKPPAVNEGFSSATSNLTVEYRCEGGKFLKVA